MQRNMDLVRTILLRMENNPSGWAPRDLGIIGYSRDQIGYHVHIMMQEGLVEGSDVTHTGSSGPEAIPRKLTWKGHEFLDLARDQDRWNRANSIVSKVGGAPISVWMRVLSELMQKSVDAVLAQQS